MLDASRKSTRIEEDPARRQRHVRIVLAVLKGIAVREHGILDEEQDKPRYDDSAFVRTVSLLFTIFEGPVLGS